MRRVIFFSAFLLLWSSPCPAGKTLIAFVGSASMPATREAAVLFERETGIHVELHFGGSGSMLSQLILSRRGDLYFPGSPDYMAKAIEKKAVDPGSVLEVAYLIPAINVPRGNPRSIKGLEDLGREGVRLAIANPHSVCVGLYAVEILEKNGLKKRIKPNRVFEHWNTKRILTIPLKPGEIHRIATIPIAISAFSHNHREARQFIDFLDSDVGKGIFKRWGYIVTEAEARRFAPMARIGGRYEVPPDW
jgi:molybdate transport system substrate-binding protein